MHILVLSKRQYMAKDLLDDRYGRFRELPLALASGGHRVQGLCLSYRRRDEGPREDIAGGARIDWGALNVSRLLSLGKRSYWRAIDELGAKSDQPRVVWACSDAPHAVLGVLAARRLAAPLVIDLYDNFEGYGLTRLPGMRSALRRSIQVADGVTCVSRPLAGFVMEHYGYRGPIEVIGNAVPADVFRPLDRRRCRRELGLPEHAVLIGTAGALTRRRGIETLFAAFRQLAVDRPDIHLVLAGPRGRRSRIPEGGRVHDLGMLSSAEVPKMLCALDVSVICNRKSAFGNYCFPQKFYESIACQVPVLVSSTAAMEEVLQQYPANLFEPDNPASLAAALNRQLEQPLALPLTAPTWADLGTRLGSFLEQVGRKARP